MSFKTFLRPSAPGGVMTLDPIKKYTAPRWFKATTGAVITPYIIALGALGISGPVSVEFDAAAGDSELFGLVANATAAFDIRIVDPGRTNYEWSNRVINGNTIMGTSQLPYYLPETYFMDVANGGKRQLTLYLTDLSGAPNNVRISFFGRTFFNRQAPAAIKKEYRKRIGDKERSRLHFLTSDQPITALGAGATVRGRFLVPSDWPFEMAKLTVDTLPAATPFEMEMWENGTSKRFSNMGLRLHSTEMWGSGQLPFILPETKVLARNDFLEFDIWNLGANPTNFYLTIGGRLLRSENVRDLMDNYEGYTGESRLLESR